MKKSNLVAQILLVVMVICILGSTVKTEANVFKSPESKPLANVGVFITDCYGNCEEYDAKDEDLALSDGSRLTVVIEFTNKEVRSLLGEKKEDPIFQWVRFTNAATKRCGYKLNFQISGNDMIYTAEVNVRVRRPIQIKTVRHRYRNPLIAMEVNHLDKNGAEYCINRNRHHSNHVRHFSKGSIIMIDITFEGQNKRVPRR